MRLAIAMCLLAGALALPAQTKFAVASIRPQPWTNEGSVGVTVRDNALYGEHADLYALVNFAYGLRADNLQLSGGPAWARHGLLSNSAGFDDVLFLVNARADEGTAPTLDEFRAMLRTLLAERFQLRVHHETKELPVFRLVVAKDGPRFRENKSASAKSVKFHDGRAFRITAVHAPLADLVSELAYASQRLVMDETGLGGFYDYDIAWSPRFSRDDLAQDDGSADVNTPPLSTALQQQLGLRLETGTAPIDTVVIDHAEKPTEN